MILLNLPRKFKQTTLNMKLVLGNRAIRKYFLIAVTVFCSFILIIRINQPACVIDSKSEYFSAQHSRRVSSDLNINNILDRALNADQVFNRDSPLIFIGGMPRSGTTLLRVLLDAHPHIRCGEETRVIPRILAFRQQWYNSPIEIRRLREAGLTDSVLNDAISSFILNIIVKHGKPAARLCNKDPFTLRSASYLHELFPNAKFIFMVRDGRAVVHSIVTRQVTISGFDLNDFRQCMKRWNSAMEAMNSQCETLGSSVCLPVHYEQLVLEPEKTLRQILKFLHVPWNETVLYHEKLINQPGEISLSKLEKSTDQVIKPININALGKWKGKIPENVAKNLDEIAPMLRKLGYDPNLGPEQYGSPDELVRKKEEELKKNSEVYIQKEEEIKKERRKITEILNRAKQAKMAKHKLDFPTSTNNENINNDILQPPGGYADSQQQPAKDAYNSALLNTNGQQQATKTGKDINLDNLSASLNYNNLAEILNMDELKSIRNKVKRLASGYVANVASGTNQEQITNNKEQHVSVPYQENLNQANMADDILSLKLIHDNLSSDNKQKEIDKNSSLIKFLAKKRKLLKQN